MTFDQFLARYQYAPNAPVATGGFSRVYKAYDSVRDRWVALKICSVNPNNAAYRLSREVELAQTIPPHRNIAHYEACHTFQTSDGEKDFAIMDWYEEGSLRDLLKRKKRLNLAQKEGLMKGILAGIEHLHQYNTIHRDIKPANVLIAKDHNGGYVPKITDFGLSKQADGVSQGVDVSNSSQFKTRLYASPEQLKNQPIQGNTDLWSFGCVVYEIFKGNSPFWEGNTGNISEEDREELHRRINAAALPESLVNVPEPYQALIRRCLVADKEERVKQGRDCWDILNGKVPEHNEATPQHVNHGDTLKDNTPPAPPPNNGIIFLGYIIATALLLPYIAIKIANSNNSFWGVKWYEWLGLAIFGLYAASWAEKRPTSFRTGLSSGFGQAAVLFLLLTLFRIIAGWAGWAQTISAVDCRPEKLQSAKAAFEQQEYARSYPIFLELAEQCNNHEAQYFVGHQALNGLGTGRNPKTAQQWLHKSAEGGYAEAQFRLGLRYLIGGDGIEQNRDLGMQWLNKADAQGHLKATYFIGDNMLSGAFGIDKDSIKALTYLERAAGQNYRDAQMKVGELYFNARQYARAKPYLEAVAESFIAEEIDSTKKDFGIAIMRQVDESFNFYRLAQIYHYGWQTPADYPQARRWYQKAADLGHEASKAILAARAEGNPWEDILPDGRLKAESEPTSPPATPPASEDYEIGGIRTTGVSYSDENAIIRASGLKVGDKIILHGPAIQEAKKAIFKLGLFTDVQVYQEKTIGDVVFLQIAVQEKPRLSGHTFDREKFSIHLQEARAYLLGQSSNSVQAITAAMNIAGLPQDLKSKLSQALSLAQQGQYNQADNIIKTIK